MAANKHWLWKDLLPIHKKRLSAAFHAVRSASVRAGAWMIIALSTEICFACLPAQAFTFGLKALGAVLMLELAAGASTSAAAPSSFSGQSTVHTNAKWPAGRKRNVPSKSKVFAHMT